LNGHAINIKVMRRRFLNLLNYKFPKIVLIIILCLPVSSFCQLKQGSVEYLKYCNGINGLTLGADISTILGNKLTFLDGNNKFDADSCLNYAYKDSTTLKMKNDLSLDMIGIRAYKNKIVNIYLFFKKSDAYKLLYDFLIYYGNFTDKPYEYKDIYNWNSSLVSLSLLYEARVDLGVAIFTSNPLKREILIMKGEAIGRSIFNDLFIHPQPDALLLTNTSAMNK